MPETESKPSTVGGDACVSPAMCPSAATPDDLCAACLAAFDRDYEEHCMTDADATCEYVAGCDKPVHSTGSRVCAEHDGPRAWKGHGASDDPIDRSPFPQDCAVGSCGHAARGACRTCREVAPGASS